MEKMKQKDAEERLKRMDTKQRRGSPTVRDFLAIFFVKFQFVIEIEILILDWFFLKIDRPRLDSLELKMF